MDRHYPDGISDRDEHLVRGSVSCLSVWTLCYHTTIQAAIVLDMTRPSRSHILQSIQMRHARSGDSMNLQTQNGGRRESIAIYRHWTGMHWPRPMGSKARSKSGVRDRVASMRCPWSLLPWPRVSGCKTMSASGLIEYSLLIAALRV